jgi:hypothetical protein
MAASKSIRWGVMAAVMGVVLLGVSDPAVVETFTGQQRLLVLGTVSLLGGLAGFLVGFVRTRSFSGLDFNRRMAALASVALGVYCLLAVPVYHVIFADTVRLLGGESPGCVLWALIVAPLLIRSGGVKALLTATLISAFVILVQVLAAFLALELPGVGLTTVFSEAGSTVPLFRRVEGCTLIMCGLDHVLFHFSQIPFLIVMTTFGYRAYQAARRASLQKPRTFALG